MIHSSNNFHAKIILCDPNTEPRGMLLTANLTHEALGRNQELSVHLTKNEIIENMKILRWAFWEYAENEIIDNKGTFYAYRPLNEITEYEYLNKFCPNHLYVFVSPAQPHVFFASLVDIYFLFFSIGNLN